MLKYSPYYLTILIVFGNFIKYFFNKLPYIELIDYIPVIFVVVLLILKIVSVRGGITYQMPFPFWVWIFFAIAHSLYSIALTSSLKIPVFGLYSYVTFLVFWYLYLSSSHKNEFNVVKYINFCTVIFSIVGILGLYQFLFDVSLFGYASSLHSRYDLNLYQMYSVVRITSVFPSVQILSVFLLLSLVVVMENFRVISRKISFITPFIILIAGIFTGSKIFTVGVILYTIYYIIFRINNRNKIFSIMIIIFATLVLISAQGIFSSLDNATIKRTMNPIFDLKGFIHSETSEDSTRMNIYISTLTDNNSLILGNGVGTANSIAVKDRLALESYILQILQELGIIGLIIFMGLLITSYKKSNLLIQHKAVIIIMTFSMIFNQAFVSVVFFPFYCLLVYPLIYSKKRSYMHNM